MAAQLSSQDVLDALAAAHPAHLMPGLPGRHEAIAGAADSTLAALDADGLIRFERHRGWALTERGMDRTGVARPAAGHDFAHSTVSGDPDQGAATETGSDPSSEADGTQPTDGGASGRSPEQVGDLAAPGVRPAPDQPHVDAHVSDPFASRSAAAGGEPEPGEAAPATDPAGAAAAALSAAPDADAAPEEEAVPGTDEPDTGRPVGAHPAEPHLPPAPAPTAAAPDAGASTDSAAGRGARGLRGLLRRGRRRD